MKPLDPTTESRPLFPALTAHPNFVFADSAGGSAILQPSITKIESYYRDSNVQIGGSYGASALCTQRIREAAQTTAELLNAESPDEICFVSSTTQGLENLAYALEATFKSGDEIIVTDTEHEANVGPWVKLGNRLKAPVHTWHLDTSTYTLPLSSLKAILSEKTRLVAVTHCSNITGTFNPIKEIAQLVHAANPRAEIVVDGVSYAPHRLVDVRELGVDYYAFSYYKVYGPHISVVYTRKKSQDNLGSLAHYFLNSNSPGPLKLVPGGPNFELSYASTAVLPYLLSLSGVDESLPIPERRKLANERIAAHEAKLMTPLLEYLKSKKDHGVRILGLEEGDSSKRAPTISFVVDGKSPKRIVQAFDDKPIGIKWGMFYANRLCLGPLKLDDEGVIRISFVHYNTIEEVQRVITALEEVL